MYIQITEAVKITISVFIIINNINYYNEKSGNEISLTENDFIMDYIKGDYFTENMGQWDDDIRFICKTNTGHIRFMNDSIYIVNEYSNSDLNRFDFNRSMDDIKISKHVVKYSFLTSQQIVPHGDQIESHYNNYFYGNVSSEWKTNVPNYKEIVYENLWNNIDIKYYFNDLGIKYDVIIHEIANPRDIRIKVEGIESLSTTGSELTIQLNEEHSIVETELFSYTMDDGHPIHSGYRLISEDIYSFDIDTDHQTSDIIIDPLLSSTYIGGSGHEYSNGICCDSDGSVTIIGRTSSIDYPIVPGSFDDDFNGDLDDICLSKFNSNLSTLLFSTYIGGEKREFCFDIASDSQGCIYGTGYTFSPDFPTTSGSIDTEYSHEDAFIFKINDKGTSLEYSTFLGGSEIDNSHSIAVDKVGSAYITGFAGSTFPTTDGAYKTTGGGIFISKINSNGSDLIFSTFISKGIGGDIDIDIDNNVYIIGEPGSDFPTTRDAFDSTANGKREIFVLKLNASGSHLEYSTFVGGEHDDVGYDLMVKNGCAYVTGASRSYFFPTTPNAYDSTYAGNSWDVIVFKLNKFGMDLIFSTFIEGGKADFGLGLSIFNNDNILIVGDTESTDFKITSPTFDGGFNGGFQDGFCSVLSSDGGRLLFSTYLGGSDDDYCIHVCLLKNQEAFIAGWTRSDDLPMTGNSYNSTINGFNYDFFILKFNFSLPNTPIDLDGMLYLGYTNITWDAPDNWKENFVIKYSIYRGPDLYRIEKIASTENTSFIDDTIEDGQSYYYYVTSENDIGESDPSNVIFITDDQDPTFIEDYTDDIGYTGDPFWISVNISDNIFIRWVIVEYSFGNKAPDNLYLANPHPSGQGNWSNVIDLPIDSLENISYRYTAIDMYENRNTTDKKTIGIRDNDLPTITLEKIQNITLTGNSYSVFVNATDNIEVKNVQMEYWYGDFVHDTIHLSMIENSTIWKTTITLYDTIDPFKFIIHASDYSGNSNHTVEYSFEMEDDDKPVFLKDETPENVFTWQRLYFIINVRDNVGLFDVWVEFWYENSTHSSFLLNHMSYNLYSGYIIPYFKPSVLYYRFHATDTSDNFNSTITDSVSIGYDNVTRRIIDRTMNKATTGEEHTFLIDIRDEVPVNRITLEYWYGSGNHFHHIIRDSSSLVYSIWIPEDSIETLYYLAEVEDSYGNTNISGISDVKIFDNDPPMMWDLQNLRRIETGGMLNIRIRASDNIGIDRVVFTYQLGWNESIDLILVKNDDNYTGNILIPTSAFGIFRYSVRAIDILGNDNLSQPISVEIIDVIPPVIDPIDNQIVSQGKWFEISCIVSDNIGIRNISWIGGPFSCYDSTFEGQIDEHGEYVITVQVTDEYGNVRSTSFNLTIVGTDSELDWNSVVILLLIISGIVSVVFISIVIRKTVYTYKPRN